MKAFLHKLMFFNDASEDPMTVIEFVVVGTDTGARKSEATRIKTWYGRRISKNHSTEFISVHRFGFKTAYTPKTGAHR